MILPEKTRNQLLEYLNQQTNLDEYKQIFQSEDFNNHLEMQNMPLDAVYTPWREETRKLFDKQTQNFFYETQETTIAYPWYKTIDAYAVSDNKQKYKPYTFITKKLSKQEVFYAVRIQNDVYYRNRQNKWQHIHWHKAQPILTTLPYQRKYDNEYQGQQEEQMRNHQKSLALCLDLLYIIQENLENQKLNQNHKINLEILDKINKEIEPYNLQIGRDGFMSYFGTIQIEIYDTKLQKTILAGNHDTIIAKSSHRYKNGALKPSMHPWTGQHLTEKTIENLIIKTKYNLDNIMLNKPLTEENQTENN